MSGGIEEPYTIAQLPRPIEHGNIVASPVCSFNGSRKRKRHEVAVGIDGEGVSIYNVQNQSTVTSYPLPPHSYLAAPPCSVYCKRTKPLHSQRQTYIALRDGFRQNKLRLVSFTEEQGKVRSEEKEPRLPAKGEHQLRHGDIAGLDILPSPDDTPSHQVDHAVLVSYKNGNVECLSSDLSTQRWHQDLSLTKGCEVEYSAVLDFDTARKGLLKSREDVLALLDLADPAAAATSDAPTLLFQITRTDSNRTVHIYALRNVTGTSLKTSRSPMENLLSYDLGSRHGSSSQTAAYELHAGTGILYQRLGQRLTLFDLSGVIPKISFELGRKGVPHVNSFARLSSATLLAISDEKIAVYDTKYGSILSSSEGHLRPSPSLSIVSQFTDLGIIVAVFQNNLVAFQVGDILDDGRRAKANGPLLLDVMGKSKFSEGTEREFLSKKAEVKRQRWEAWKAEVDRLADEKAIDKLEELVAKDLHIPINEQPQQNGQAKAHGLANGHSISQADLWQLPPKAYDPQHVETRKPIYLLAKSFMWSAPAPTKLGEGCKLQLALVSRNILRWLALAGYLTPFEIEHALPKSVQGSESRPRIAPGDIMAAIQEAEPSFTLLHDLVSLPIHWDTAEVVAGLQKLVWSLDDRDRLEDDDGDIKMIEGAGDAEGRVQSEASKAIRQVENAHRLLDFGLQRRSKACKILLARLQAFPRQDVATTMHKMLTYKDLYFLISLLRVELFDGNWALQYIESYNDENVDPGDLGVAQEIRSGDQAIRSIARLLSCAIDAVGMSGWLVGLSADTVGAHELIQSLRNEIAAATEGLYDANYIEVLLTEVGKAAASLEEEPESRWRKRKADATAEQSAEDRVLPLGRRKRQHLPGGKSSKNGQYVNPTILADERNRNVGKYSFERVRI